MFVRFLQTLRASTLLFVVVGIGATLASGCAGLDVAKKERRHILFFDSEGLPVMHTEEDGETRLDRRGFRNRATTILNAVKESEPKRIVLFLHGGLIGNDDALSTLRDTLSMMKAAGEDPETDTFPILVAWDTAFMSSYFYNVYRVREGKAVEATSPAAWGLVAPYVFTDIAQTAVHVPIALASNTIFAVDDALGLRLAEHTDGLSLSPQTASLKLYLGADRRSVMQKYFDWFGWIPLVATKVPTQFGIELGGVRAWKEMVRRSNVLFVNATDEWRGLNAKPNEMAALPVFLEQLFTLVGSLNEKRAYQGKRRIELTVVGHSTGAILVNKILRKYSGDVRFDNIVYMANASSLRDTNDAVFHVLRQPQSKKTRIYHLVLHQGAEIQERPVIFNGWPRWFEILPRGSLLVWLDRQFTDPTDFLDRRAGRLVNLLTTLRQVPNDMRGRIHVKAFDFGWGLDDKQCEKGLPGNECWDRLQPQSHDAFDNFPYWRPEFWEPFKLEQGGRRYLPVADSCFEQEIPFRLDDTWRPPVACQDKPWVTVSPVPRTPLPIAPPAGLDFSRSKPTPPSPSAESPTAESPTAESPSAESPPNPSPEVSKRKMHVPVPGAATTTTTVTSGPKPEGT